MIKFCVQFTVNYLFLNLSETLIIFCSDYKNIASHVRSSCEVWSVLSEVCLSHQSVIISPVSQIIPKHQLCTLSKGAFSNHITYKHLRLLAKLFYIIKLFLKRRYLFFTALASFTSLPSVIHHSDHSYCGQNLNKQGQQ